MVGSGFAFAPDGATPENVNERVQISFDQGLLQARKIIARLLKKEAAAKRKAARPVPQGRSREAAA